MWGLKGWFGGGVKDQEGQDWSSNFILRAVGTRVGMGEAGSDLSEEKITPSGMGIGEKETQWSLKEVLGQVCPPVFYVQELCEQAYRDVSLCVGVCVCVGVMGVCVCIYGKTVSVWMIVCGLQQPCVTEDSWGLQRIRSRCQGVPRPESPGPQPRWGLAGPGLVLE